MSKKRKRKKQKMRRQYDVSVDGFFIAYVGTKLGSIETFKRPFTAEEAKKVASTIASRSDIVFSLLGKPYQFSQLLSDYPKTVNEILFFLYGVTLELIQQAPSVENLGIGTSTGKFSLLEETVALPESTFDTFVVSIDLDVFNLNILALPFTIISKNDCENDVMRAIDTLHDTDFSDMENELKSIFNLPPNSLHIVPELYDPEETVKEFSQPIIDFQNTVKQEAKKHNKIVIAHTNKDTIQTRKDLANVMRQRQVDVGHDHGMLQNISDVEIITAYITCSNCGEQQYTLQDIDTVLETAPSNLDEFWNRLEK